MVIRRQERAGQSAAPVEALVDTAFLNAFPDLHDHMTQVRWEDGSLRNTSSVTLFIEGAQWKACLNDRDAGLVAFVAGRSFNDVLRALNDGIKGDTLDWRPSRSAVGSPRRKS
jgi:hypothetical protein